MPSFIRIIQLIYKQIKALRPDDRIRDLLFLGPAAPLPRFICLP